MEQDRYKEAFSKFDFDLTEEEIEKTLKTITAKAANNSEDKSILKKIFNCIDLTSLKATDNDETILALTEKINRFTDQNPDLPTIAGICVYPCYAGIVSQSLETEEIKTICVAGGFPSSQTMTEVKIAEVSLAIKDGAEEIDIVQPAGRILGEEYEYVANEISEIKEVCKDKTLKVILETGELKSIDEIKKASIIAMYSGADFIKTSTGKEKEGATPRAFYIMCQAVKEYAGLCGRKVGVKAAGGVRTVRDAVIYYSIAEYVLGKEWLQNDLFRIGATGLANSIISEFNGKKVTPF